MVKLDAFFTAVGFVSGIVSIGLCIYLVLV